MLVNLENRRAILYNRRERSRVIKTNFREQDVGGVGGHGVHLSPWIYQEYNLRHRIVCKTPAESGQEY